jgi:hypothetical protein
MLATIQFRISCLPASSLKNIQTILYKTIILPVVLYGCETWCLILKQKHRLRVLRRIFGPGREEVTEGWRKQHEELHNL